MLDRARRIGWQKRTRNSHPGKRRLEVVDVPLEFRLPDIA
jgi:hypothetical protein